MLRATVEAKMNGNVASQEAIRHRNIEANEVVFNNGMKATDLTLAIPSAVQCINFWETVQKARSQMTGHGFKNQKSSIAVHVGAQIHVLDHFLSNRRPVTHEATHAQGLSLETSMENVSVVTELTLEGLNYPFEERVVLFCVTLLWYLMILAGNIIIIVAIILDKSLHEPMYIFLCNLCINSLYGTVGFYPKFLFDLLNSHVISYAGCMLQGYVIHSSVCGDFSLLALMAFDRYVALCRPLIYHSVMTKRRVYVLVILSWIVPLFCMFMNTATLLQTQLCGSHINRLYCINFMIVRLACSPPLANVYVSYFNIFFYFGHFLLIIWSYLYLIKTCLFGRKNWAKFMQTCVPHIISLSVSTFSVLLDLLYMRLGSSNLSQNLSNFMAMEILLIPPLLNPVVYGMNLTKIRTWIFKVVHLNWTEAECQNATES
ncbi:olfactory receptor 11A1-like [Synchiropus picturatus]